MSEGAICECGHYLVHHDNEGYCIFEWQGERCECTFYRDDSGPLVADAAGMPRPKDA